MSDEERNAARQAAAEEERAARERTAKGIKDPVLSSKDRELLDRIIQLGTLAKYASRTKVAVHVFDENGKPTTLEERLGNEDLIFVSLLNQFVGRRPEER